MVGGGLSIAVSGSTQGRCGVGDAQRGLHFFSVQTSRIVQKPFVVWSTSGAEPRPPRAGMEWPLFATDDQELFEWLLMPTLSAKLAGSHCVFS